MVSAEVTGPCSLLDCVLRALFHLSASSLSPAEQFLTRLEVAEGAAQRVKSPGGLAGDVGAGLLPAQP